MVRVEVIKEFTLADFKKLKEIVRFNQNNNEEGRLYFKDKFLCSNEMAKYLMGNNISNVTVVKIIEIIPEEKKVRKTKKKE